MYLYKSFKNKKLSKNKVELSAPLIELDTCESKNNSLFLQIIQNPTD